MGDNITKGQEVEEPNVPTAPEQREPFPGQHPPERPREGSGELVCRERKGVGLLEQSGKQGVVKGTAEIHHPCLRWQRGEVSGKRDSGRKSRTQVVTGVREETIAQRGSAATPPRRATAAEVPNARGNPRSEGLLERGERRTRSAGGVPRGA